MIKIFQWYKSGNFDNKLFYAAWTLLMAALLFTPTAWWVQDVNYGSGILEITTKLMKWTATGICCIVILFKLIQKEYSKQAVIGYTSLLVIFAISAYFSKNPYILSYWFFFAAAYRKSAKKILEISALLTAILLFVVVLCSLTGLTSNIPMGPANTRYSLGFNYCTTAPFLFLFFMLEYILLRKEKLRFWELLILEIVNVFFFIMTHTRTVFYLGSVIVIFFAVQSLFKNHWRILPKARWLWLVLPIVICAAAIILHCIYDEESTFFVQLNNFLHNRLQLGKSAIDTYEITLFGQTVDIYGYSIIQPDNISEYYNFVDCSYLAIMVQFGIVTIISVVAIYTLAIYNADKAKNYWVVFAVLFVLILGVTEERLMGFVFNILPMLAFTKLDEEGFLFKKRITEQ